MAEDDKALVAACLNGQTEAFDELVNRYQKPIFNAALKMLNDYDEAQEVAQIAFVKAFEKLASYRPEYKFFSWLYRIVMNEAINHLKRSRRLEPFASDIVSPDPDPAKVLASKRLNVQVQGAIAELSLDYRAMLVMKHFTDLSLRELAYVFEIPVQTVKSRLYTARRKLCEILKRKGVRADD